MESVNNHKLARKERFQQIDRADSIKSISKKGLKSSLNSVQKLAGDLSRTSEQELFTAIVYDGLGKIDQNLQTKFMDKLPTLIQKVGSFDSQNAVFRGTRRALKQLVQEHSLARGAGKILRKFALGKSQLDTDRTRLSSAETASNFDLIFKQVSANKIASDSELIKFNDNNNAEFPRNNYTSPSNSISNIDMVDPLKAEFEMRKKLAEGVVKIISNEDQTISPLVRMNKVIDFYVSESIAKDASVHQRAEGILDAINSSGSDLDRAKAAYSMMSEYMKSVFQLEIAPLE